MKTEQELNEEPTVELTDKELEQAAGGTVPIPPNVRLRYRCLLCSWKGIFSSNDAAVQAHTAACPGCKGNVTRIFHGA